MPTQTKARPPRIYISGPMTGLPAHNFPAFHAATKAWRAKGWEVDNPAEAFGGDASLAYKVYARRDVDALHECNAIALLPGWDAPTARGSVWEAVIAQKIGLDVYDATKPVVPPTPLCGAARRTALPTQPAERKAVPLARGCLDYFPAALAEVAHVSHVGNEQHNPGQSMHHARGKSSDHADCVARHLVERGALDTDGLRHSAKAAWRALALLQEELEAHGAPLARGARLPDPEPQPAEAAEAL